MPPKRKSVAQSRKHSTLVSKPTDSEVGVLKSPSRLQSLKLLAAIVLILAAIWIATANLRFEHHLRVASLSELQNIATQQPANPRVFYYLALSAGKAGDARLAMDSLERAAKLDPDNYSMWQAWAKADSAAVGPDAARQILHTFLLSHPRSAPAYADLSEIDLAQNEPTQAYTEAYEATKIDPNLPDAWKAMGDAAVVLSQPSNAETAYRHLTKLRPADWHSFSSLGNVLYREGRYTDALPQFQDAARLAGTHSGAPSAQLGQTMLHFAQTPDQYNKARTEIQHALPLPMSQEEVYTSLLDLGESYLQNGQASEALPWLQNAEAHGRYEPAVYYDLYNTYRMLGDTQKANLQMQRHTKLVGAESRIKTYTLRVQTSPSDFPAYMQLAAAQIDRGHFSDAYRTYEQLLTKDPSSQDAANALNKLEREHGGTAIAQ